MNDLTIKGHSELIPHQNGAKSILIRRSIVDRPEIAKALDPIERHIFISSTKTQICELDDSVLVDKMANIFRFIAIDIGYKIPANSHEWTYICTRLLAFIKRHYAQLTLSDIRIAFEMAVSGNLNEYLPKDSNGNPDNRHYQNFNIDYFAKILNAYRSIQNNVILKAHAALPVAKEGANKDERDKYRQEITELCRMAFLRFKYKGKIELKILEDRFIYNWLYKCGLADKIEETEEDRKKALGEYLKLSAYGLITNYDADHVRRNGIHSDKIDYTAFEIARKKEIKRSFIRMIDDELQVDNYLNDLI